MTRGPQSKYTPEIGEYICDHIASGGSPRTAAIAASKEFGVDIQAGTIRSWRNVYPLFASRYALAREDRGDTSFERVGEVVNSLLSHEIDPQTATAAVNGLRWMAAKDNDRYGDKVTMDVKHNLSALTDKEMAERLLEAVPFLAITCQPAADDAIEDQCDQ